MCAAAFGCISAASRPQVIKAAALTSTLFGKKSPRAVPAESPRASGATNKWRKAGKAAGNARGLIRELLSGIADAADAVAAGAPADALDAAQAAA